MFRSLSIALVGSVLASCASTRTETEKKTLFLDSSPPGAQVSMENERRDIALGTAPTKAEVELATDYVDFNPWSLVLSGTWCGLTAGFLYLGSREESGSAGQPLAIVGGVSSAIVCLVTGADTVITAIQDGDKERTYYKAGPPKFGAELRGYEPATLSLASDELPPDAPLTFHLKRDALAEEPRASGETEVLAVFDLTTAASSTSTQMLDQLTEYLSSRLAETGRYRIVPRDQIHRAIVEQKMASYKDCVEESCQIELGKSVAAQLSLRTQLIHIGDECALSATMYDLKLEATSTGASVRTSCRANELMDGVDVLVHKLTK